MIIVKLMGGLGNQMFQYATGRRLAHFNNTDLKIDLSWFDNIPEIETPREYCLDKFFIQENFATKEEIELLTRRKKGFGGDLLTIATGRKLGSATSYVRERYFHFDPEVLDLPDNIYLEGYWQSEKYFSAIEDIIRKEFTVKTIQEGESRVLADFIASCNSISLHIRRGDYVSNPAAKSVHGTCDLEYYLSCVEQLSKIVKNPHFIVFSDDHDWVLDNLKLSHPMILVNNGPDKAYEDLRLQRQCKHHIIANSSFSWWGAWLCSNQDKIVCAPSKWFKNASINTEDLIPHAWQRI